MIFQRVAVVLLIGSFCGVLWGAAVDQSRIEENVAGIEQEIQSLSTSIANDQDSQRSLKERIQQQQTELASLEAETRSQQNQLAAQKEQQQALRQHEDVALQQALAGLREQIRYQEQLVEQRRKTISETVAVDTSDLAIRNQQQLETEQRRLGELRSQYFAIIEARQARLRETQRSMSEQAQNEQSEQMALELAETQAEANLNQLKSEMEKVNKSINEKNERLEQLQQERNESMTRTS